MRRTRIHLIATMTAARGLSAACPSTPAPRPGPPARARGATFKPPAVRYFYTDLDGTLLDHRSRIPLRQLAFIGDSGNDVGAARWLQPKGGRCFVVENGIPSLWAAN